MINYNIEVVNEYPQWNTDDLKVDDFARRVIEFYAEVPDICEKFCLKDYEYKTVSFDILFCDGEKTHEINRDYRNKDYPADIITFALFADAEEGDRFIPEFEINLGEIIIALDKIIDSANEKGIDKETELKFMISHGIMHLLGFDHQTEEEFDFVVSQQKKALESMGIRYEKI